ncbi:MAG: hypothetical protein HRT89_08065, partial [Lentisphaeria bacterium]|nr:hypothetical protein [Lentisphaeria bacterium]
MKKSIFIFFICLSLFAIELRNGKKVLDGESSYDKRGVFIKSPSGGKHYKWNEIKINSLPVNIRNEQRHLVLNYLYKADHLYTSGRYQTAAPYYREAFRKSFFLTPLDKTLAVYKDISKKAKSYIYKDEKWLKYSSWMHARGFKYYHGKWRSADDYKAARQFVPIISASLKSSKPELYIKRLGILLEKYPESNFQKITIQLTQDLENFQ